MDGEWVDRMRDRMARRGRRRPDPVDGGEPAPANGDAPAAIPIVPYWPVRCPRCEHGEKITDGVHDVREGRKRYHVCKRCRMQFHSIEVAPGGLRNTQ